MDVKSIEEAVKEIAPAAKMQAVKAATKFEGCAYYGARHLAVGDCPVLELDVNDECGVCGLGNCSVPSICCFAPSTCRIDGCFEVL